MNQLLTILEGDAVERLRSLETGSVHCCVTSPPYWGLRDYSCDGQLGLERTPEQYVAKLVEVFREVKRVLRKDGTLWLNMGDTYNSRLDASHGGWNASGNGLQVVDKRGPTNSWQGAIKGLPQKNLLGMPWRLAFGLQAEGWILRSDIIWAKPNPMPESCTDRPTKAHEYIFLLTKSANYFYDAEAIKEKAVEGLDLGILRSIKAANGQGPTDRASIDKRLATGINIREGNPSGSRNKRSVWTIATQPYPEAHFATFPEEIPKLCILAGTSAKGCCAKCGAPWERVVEREVVSVSDSPRYSGVSLRNDAEDGRTERSSKTLGWQPTCKCCVNCDERINKSNRVEHYCDCGSTVLYNIDPCTVLDPFAGSGTTGAVALELGRKAILIELNPKYIALIRQRCDVTPGLALA